MDHGSQAAPCPTSRATKARARDRELPANSYRTVKSRSACLGPVTVDWLGRNFGRVEPYCLLARQTRLLQRSHQRLRRIDRDIGRDPGAFPILARLDVEGPTDRHPHREML